MNNMEWTNNSQDVNVFSLLRDAKGAKGILEVRTSKATKVRYGVHKFKEIRVNFDVVLRANEV